MNSFIIQPMMKSCFDFAIADYVAYKSKEGYENYDIQKQKYCLNKEVAGFCIFEDDTLLDCLKILKLLEAVKTEMIIIDFSNIPAGKDILGYKNVYDVVINILGVFDEFEELNDVYENRFVLIRKQEEKKDER